MKLLLIVGVLLSIAFLTRASAQLSTVNHWYVGATLELGLPLGDLSSLAGIGYGGRANVGYLTSTDFMVTAGVGYFRFPGRGVDIPSINVSLPTPNMSFIPFTIGGRYLFSPSSDTRPMIGAETGVYIVRTGLNVIGFSIGETNAAFGVAPLVGVLANTTHTINPDLFVQYTTMFRGFSPSWVGLNAGAMGCIR